MSHEILSSEQMARADRLQAEAGTSGFSLMRNAGKAAADIILKRHKKRKALVLCGPGNNGGDGFIVAVLLKRGGWKVRVACLAHMADLKGDAAQAARQWRGKVESFTDVEIASDELIIDAVFGTGFSREIDGAALAVFNKIREGKNPVVAIDIPSGVNGSNGLADPATIPAELTITFGRKKAGHALNPGKALCSEIVVCDIGITDEVFAKAAHLAVENRPDLWRSVFPRRRENTHKYDYGHAVIFGAPLMTGATRLAAEACARIGAGLVSVVSQGDAAFIYRTTLPAHIIVEELVADNIYRNLEGKHRTAVLVGPGAGKDSKTMQEMILTACSLNRKLVLDADALNALAETRSLSTVGAHCVLTPHEGEFARLFPDIKGGRLEKALEAARKSRAVVVLKGSDTVIAAPDGRAVINNHASPSLASGGTGDVLAGMITGLLAQGMAQFEAACAAVWIHGECSIQIGPGLVAADIAAKIPEILRKGLV